jgi:ComF family protein
VKPGYDQLRSWAIFNGPIQKAVHNLKYKRDLSLGLDLSGHLTNFVKELQLAVDIVIPVPLGKKRLKERGYNQASLIAFPLAIKLGMKYTPNGLVRIRETESQVGLNYKDRLENVKDAFQANSRLISGKNILLIDDVATTGSTLSSCTQALKAGGASTVYAITLARALAGYGS